MAQLLFKFALAFTALLLIPVLLIQAQPYDGRELRAFFTPPEDCPAPCFMGIRPGNTPADEVYRTIRDHAWVSRLFDNTSIADDGGIPGVTGTIFWEWSGAQPEWIDPTVRGQVRVRRGVAQYLLVQTRLQLGDVRLTLDTPDWEIALISERPDELQKLVYQRTAYQRNGYLFETLRIPCPAKALWKLPVNLTVWQQLALTPSTDDTTRQNSGCRGG